MKILYPGHRYEVDFLSSVKNSSSSKKGIIQFVQRSPHPLKDGTTCQELLRVLIHRVKILNKEKNWTGNKYILRFLRMALILFECRNLLKKTEEDDLYSEYIQIDPNNLHFQFNEGDYVTKNNESI